MFLEYLDRAMQTARFEEVEDGTFFATIPGFEGVMASGETIEECREELREALEGWLILGLWMNDESLPKLGELDLVPRQYVAAQARHEPTFSPRADKAS